MDVEKTLMNDEMKLLKKTREELDHLDFLLSCIQDINTLNKGKKASELIIDIPLLGSIYRVEKLLNKLKEIYK